MPRQHPPSTIGMSISAGQFPIASRSRLSTSVGNVVWQQELGSYRAGHGDGVSPIVCGERVIVAKEHDGPSKLFALQRASGEILWEVDRETKAQWATPCVFRGLNSQGELIFVSWSQGITGVNPQTGAIQWEADVFDKSHIEASIASPIVSGDRLIVLSGWLSVRQEVVVVRPSPRQRTC